MTHVRHPKRVYRDGRYWCESISDTWTPDEKKKPKADPGVRDGRHLLQQEDAQP